MGKKIKIFWRNKDNYGIGATYGYRTHAKNMQQELERLPGVGMVYNEKDNFDFAVNICAPHQFVPIKGKRNIVFTMTERIDMLEKDKPKILGSAEIIVVPTEFSKTEFQKHFPDTIIETCPEGFYTKDYPFFQRRKPTADEPFIFFWNGASNQRKGCVETWEAYRKWHESGRMPDNVQLVFKTTAADEYGRPIPGYGISRTDNTRVTLDARNLSTAGLCRLYHKAHAFMFPTCGEGWGLTLTEAAATGLPCIYTDFSAPHDWMHPDGGFPLKNYSLIPSKELFSYDFNLNMTKWTPDSVIKTKAVVKPGDYAIFKGKEKAFAAATDVKEITENMEYIYHHYDEALRRGKIASDHLHENYSWKQAAERFVEICMRHK